MRVMNICKRLPHFYLSGKTVIRDGSLLAAFSKSVSTFLQGRWMGNGKRQGDAEGKVLFTLSAAFLSCWWLRHKQQVWQQPKHSPEPRYSLTRCSSKGDTEFNSFQARFPLPVPQPAITPQSQSPSSLHTRLLPEGRHRSFTCTPRLQKNRHKFPF